MVHDDYLFLTDLQKNVFTVWIGYINSLSPQVTRYVCDLFLCENINMNTYLEADFLCVGSLSHDLLS